MEHHEAEHQREQPEPGSDRDDAAWDALHSEAIPQIEKDYLIDQVRGGLLEESMSDEERVAVLARRMRA